MPRAGARRSELWRLLEPEERELMRIIHGDVSRIRQKPRSLWTPLDLETMRAYWRASKRVSRIGRGVDGRVNPEYRRWLESQHIDPDREFNQALYKRWRRQCARAGDQRSDSVHRGGDRPAADQGPDRESRGAE